MNILTENIERLSKKLEALQRKAAKLNLPSLSFSFGPEFAENSKVVRALTIDHGTLQIPGDWQFVASLQVGDEVDGNNRNEITAREGALTPSEREGLISIKLACGHCQQARRRVKTYALRNSSGAMMQLGTACVQPYLGMDASIVADYYSMLEAADDACESERGGSCGPSAFPTPEVIKVACSAIRQFGFRSSRQAEDTQKPGTADDVRGHFGGDERHAVKVTQEDINKADEILASYTADILPKYKETPDELSDFQYKLAMLVNRGYAKWKDLGILAGAVGAYVGKREKVQYVQYPAKNGDKVRVKATCIACRVIDNGSRFGSKLLLKLVTSTNELLVTFYSGNTPARVDQVYEVTGTVKIQENSEKYGPQTILTRCKFVEVETPAVEVSEEESELLARLEEENRYTDCIL